MASNNRKTIAFVAVLVCYLTIFAVVISAVVKAFGADSAAMYIAVIALGPVALILLSTHDGLNKWLNRWDDR